MEATTVEQHQTLFLVFPAKMQHRYIYIYIYSLSNIWLVLFTTRLRPVFFNIILCNCRFLWWVWGRQQKKTAVVVQRKPVPGDDSLPRPALGSNFKADAPVLAPQHLGGQGKQPTGPFVALSSFYPRTKFLWKKQYIDISSLDANQVRMVKGDHRSISNIIF